MASKGVLILAQGASHMFDSATTIDRIFGTIESGGGSTVLYDNDVKPVANQSPAMLQITSSTMSGFFTAELDLKVPAGTTILVAVTDDKLHFVVS